MREMKDSGIEWVGAIPNHWRVSKIKQIVRWKSVKGQPDLPVLSLYRDYGVIPKDSRDDNHNVTSLDTSGYKVVEHGDLVINKMKAWQGSLAVSEYNGIVSPAYHICKITSENICKKYLHYLLRDASYLPEYMRLSTGLRVGQWDLSFDDFKNIPFLVPPLAEQERIAAFLDAECAEIDAVLEKTRASIEEYKKLKQAVITQAVTKGVRGDRPMKNSGIEWIGEIPAEWTASKIKYCTEFSPSCNTSHLSEDSLVTFTPMECIKNGYFENREAHFSALSSSYTQYQDGDIVFAKVTPCFENGNIAIMQGLSAGVGFGSSELFVIRPQSINTEFIFYYLQNDIFKQYACATMTGTGGLKRVSPTFVRNYSVFIPCNEEQLEIVRYLNEKCSGIEVLIAKKQQYLTEIENYKKSLIYEYVTGKREV